VRSVDTVQVFVHYSLAELFLGSHLAALQTDATLTADRAQQWWEQLKHVNDDETLLISFTAFIVVGANT
jgi:hypothetical protein